MALLKSDTVNLKLVRRIAGVAVSLAAMAMSTAASIAQTGELSGGQQEALASLRETTGGDVKVNIDPAKGTPRQIKISNSAASRATGRSGNPQFDASTVAREFLNTNSQLIGIDNPAGEFSIRHTSRDSQGRSHVRFEQTLDGLKVWPAEVVVHLNGAGEVDLVNGTFRKTPSGISTAAAIDERSAVTLALAAAGLGQADVESSELIIYSGADAARLAWKLELHAGRLTHWVVVIDAQGGETLMAFNKVCSGSVRGSGQNLFGQTEQIDVWQDGGSYYMINAAKQMFDPSSNPTDVSNSRGCITVLDANHSEFDASGNISWNYVSSNSPNSWMLPDAVSAAVGLSQTYDYYLSTFNRNSLDGNGGTIIGIVRYSQGMQNAFWDGEVMVFGDGAPFAGALDVVAHELTHGVTQNESNLVYQDQAGALNEAMSDIFGEAVEAFVRGRCDWLKGADMNMVIQNYADPHSVEQIPGLPNPAKMSEFASMSEDNGGVHINSSIINHAFYLLAEGMNNSVGMGNAAAIFYRANSEHMTQGSQFIDCRLACVASAEELFGAGSAQVAATIAAFDAVEIFENGSIPTPNPTPGPVGGDDAFEDNDTPETAAQLGAGVYSMNCIDDDWFVLNVTEAGWISVEIAGPSGDLDMYMFDGNGYDLGYSEEEGSQEYIEAYVDAGMVYVAVTPYEGQTSSYQIAINGSVAGGPVTSPMPNPTPAPAPMPSPSPAPSPLPTPAPSPMPTPGPIDDGGVDISIPVSCAAGGPNMLMATMVGMLGLGAATPMRRRRKPAAR